MTLLLTVAAQQSNRYFGISSNSSLAVFHQVLSKQKLYLIFGLFDLDFL